MSRNTRKNYLLNEDGAVAVVAAMMLPVLMGLGGLAVDASVWFMSQRDLQTAADAGALAAAYEIANGDSSNAETVAGREAGNNGFDSANGALELTVQEEADGFTHIYVHLSQDADLWFSRIFIDSMSVSAQAEAIFDEAMDGSACILSLDETEEHALKTSGNVTVSMPNCGVAVNSEDEEALYLNGSVLVDVADVRIHGGYATDGNVDFQYDSLRTGTSPVADPYADLDVPSYSACSTANKKKGNKYTANATLNPGVYCGGITISGNTAITFNPGVYILDGGDFKVTGGGSMTGEGVSFVLTNSSTSGGSYGKLDISGGRTISFSAPAEGSSMEGVVFYQDRDAPDTAANSITGTAEIRIDGSAYFPAAEIVYGGTATNTSASNPCSRIIGRLVTLHGTPHISNSCDGSAAQTINMPGTDTIRLVN